MTCEVQGMIGDICRHEREKKPSFCQAQNQANTDSALFVRNPMLRDTATSLVSDFSRAYTGCPQLADIITGIRQELAKRQTGQNQHLSPPGE